MLALWLYCHFCHCLVYWVVSRLVWLVCLFQCTALVRVNVYCCAFYVLKSVTLTFHCASACSKFVASFLDWLLFVINFYHNVPLPSCGLVSFCSWNAFSCVVQYMHIGSCKMCLHVCLSFQFKFVMLAYCFDWNVPAFFYCGCNIFYLLCSLCGLSGCDISRNRNVPLNVNWLWMWVFYFFFWLYSMFALPTHFMFWTLLLVSVSYSGAGEMLVRPLPKQKPFYCYDWIVCCNCFTCLVKCDWVMCTAYPECPCSPWESCCFFFLLFFLWLWYCSHVTFSIQSAVIFEVCVLDWLVRILPRLYMFICSWTAVIFCCFCTWKIAFHDNLSFLVFLWFPSSPFFKHFVATFDFLLFSSPLHLCQKSTEMRIRLFALYECFCRYFNCHM